MSISGNCDVLVRDTSMDHLNQVLDKLCSALAGESYRVVRIPSTLDLSHAPLAHAKVLACYGGTQVGAQLMDRAPMLRGIASCVSGTEGFDFQAAADRGILISNVATALNTRAMAEATVLLLLHLFYDLDGTRRGLIGGEQRPQQMKARVLQGKTIGLIGWGAISQALCSLLEHWDVQLQVHSRRELLELPAHVRRVSLSTLLCSSDAVCVLTGATVGAPPLLGRDKLSLMRSNAYLLNLSRGSLVDESALAELLRSDAIGGAALDVFAQEPLSISSPLRSLSNVILTPHHVGHTAEGEASLAPALIANVSAMLKGDIPISVRNPEVSEQWLMRFQ